LHGRREAAAVDLAKFGATTGEIYVMTRAAIAFEARIPIDKLDLQGPKVGEVWHIWKNGAARSSSIMRSTDGNVRGET
jgi:hypothetical protein